jgi:hypothetical protein
VALAPSLAACDDDLPRPSLVDAPRLLAIRATPPEVEPGARVTLDALVVRPGDAPAPAGTRHTWRACIVPMRGDTTGGFDGFALPTGAEPPPAPGPATCAEAEAAGLSWGQALGEGVSATLDVPADLFADDAALRVAFALGDTPLEADQRELLLGVPGLVYRVELTIDAPDLAAPIRGAKAVRVARPHPASGDGVNHAPPAPEVVLAPASPVVAGEAVTLTPTQPAPGPETYAVLLPGATGEATFDLQVRLETWTCSLFATAGRFDADVIRTAPPARATWRPGRDTLGPVDLWFVLRDGRGGTAWSHTRVVVAPP